eukprot:TRINITY_DN6343_c0_g1_i1.p1 TRINITY_DN6343_c0_g1~~TRINITY_DN6343_c0_g1_i1.p1  ORF type:complete len:283 (-),score=33.40 TRINITY_DN6343_c0_g1_i1:109-957(-)
MIVMTTEANNSTIPAISTQQAQSATTQSEPPPPATAEQKLRPLPMLRSTVASAERPTEAELRDFFNYIEGPWPVNANSPCISWTGPARVGPRLHSPLFCFRGTTHNALRLCYLWFRGDVPVGAHIRACAKVSGRKSNFPCMNPYHFVCVDQSGRSRKRKQDIPGAASATATSAGKRGKAADGPALPAQPISQPVAPAYVRTWYHATRSNAAGLLEQASHDLSLTPVQSRILMFLVDGMDPRLMIALKAYELTGDHGTLGAQLASIAEHAEQYYKAFVTPVLP